MPAAQPRQIRFNAFDMNCVAHQSSGLWRHPEDQAWRSKDVGYWTHLAKVAERGNFDSVFIADVLGTYDVYGGDDTAAIRNGAQGARERPRAAGRSDGRRHRERGLRDKVHHIGHEGTWFKVPGIHLSEPSPQRTPLVFQAGASPRGIRFASRHAEAIFIASPNTAIAKQSVDSIRQSLIDAGRTPDAAKVDLLLTIIVDETDELARAEHRDYLSYVSPEGALTFLSGWMGVDLSEYGLDDPIGDVEINAIQSIVAAFQAENPDGKTWTGSQFRVGAPLSTIDDSVRVKQPVGAL